jgi:hypothetical protein
MFSLRGRVVIAKGNRIGRAPVFTSSFGINPSGSPDFADVGLEGLIDRPDKEDVPVGTAMHLNPGDEIRVSLVNSRVVEGVFRESTALDSTTYASKVCTISG